MPAKSYIKWTDPKTNEPKFVKFDVVETETHTQAAEVTEHPVEDGTNIADHVKHNAEEIKLEVFVSGSPIHPESLTSNDERSSGTISPAELPYPAGIAAPPVGLLGLLGLTDTRQRPAYVAALNFPGGALSPSVVWSELYALWKKSLIVDVVTPLKVYTDMVLVNIDTPRSAAEGDGMRASISFKNIRRVQSKLVRAPAASIPRAAKTADKGKQDTSTDTSNGKQQQSVLKNLADRAGGNPARNILANGL